MMNMSQLKIVKHNAVELLWNVPLLSPRPANLLQSENVPAPARKNQKTQPTSVISVVTNIPPKAGWRNTLSYTRVLSHMSASKLLLQTNNQHILIWLLWIEFVVMPLPRHNNWRGTWIPIPVIVPINAVIVLRPLLICLQGTNIIGKWQLKHLSLTRKGFCKCFSFFSFQHSHQWKAIYLWCLRQIVYLYKYIEIP